MYLCPPVPYVFHWSPKVVLEPTSRSLSKADGNGTVGQSFAPLPANLRDAGVQKQSDGELFAKITLGFRRHPPLASTVSDGDRWAVVNYIQSMKKKSG
jgi:hypothetical protein